MEPECEIENDRGNGRKKRLHHRQQGDGRDPLRKRKNKQEWNGEEEELAENNKNRKDLFPSLSQLFSHGKGQVVMQRVTDDGIVGIWN